MSRSRPPRRLTWASIPLLLIGLLSGAGCVEDEPGPARVDARADADVDVHASADAAPDKTAPDGPPADPARPDGADATAEPACAPRPTDPTAAFPTNCVIGVPGGICGDVVSPSICRQGVWICPPGHIEARLCGCHGLSRLCWLDAGAPDAGADARP
jgi:hypothetical protein